MTSRSTGRYGSGIDFRREAEEAARSAGLPVDEWSRGVLGATAPGRDARPAEEPRPVVPPEASGEAVNRILTSLDRLGDRIRSLAAASAPEAEAEPARPAPTAVTPPPAEPAIARDAAPDPLASLPAETAILSAPPAGHSGIDLQRAIEEIARKRDALERAAAARPAPEARVARPAVDPAEIASLRSDIAAIRQSVETGDSGARLRSLEDGYDEIVRRLDQLRGAIDNPRTVADLVQRLAEIRRLLAQAPTDTQLAGLSDRIERIDERLSLVGDARDVNEVSRQVAALANAVAGLDPAALIGVIDARLEDVGARVALFEQRLGGLDSVGRIHESVERQASVLSVLAQRSEQVPRIAHEMERQSATIDSVSQHLDHLPGLVTDVAALRGSVDAEADRVARGISDLGARIHGIEQRIADAPTPDHLATSVHDRVAGEFDRQSALVDDVARRLDPLPHLASDVAALRGLIGEEADRAARGLDQLGARIDDLGRRIVEPPSAETVATLVSERIADVFDDVGARVDDLGRRIVEPPAAETVATLVSERIAGEFDRQSVLVGDIGARIDALPDLSAGLSAIRQAIDADSDRTAHGLDALIDRIDDLGRRVGEAPSAETLAALVEDRIAEVARRLDDLGGPLEPGKFALLDTRIADVAEKLEARIAELATTPLAVDLPVELAESLARIEAQLSGDRTVERLGELEERIVGLTAVVADLDRLAPPDFGVLEAALAEVRAHLTDLTPPSLAGLESEVRTLTQAVRRVESAGLDPDQIERLDRRIGEIAIKLDRRPAEEALIEAAVARFEATLASALGGDIRRDFADLKSELRGAAERDRSLLIAIGDAVERLASGSREPVAAPAWAGLERRRGADPLARTEPAPVEPRLADRPVETSAWLEIERTLAETAARADRFTNTVDATEAPTLDAAPPLEEDQPLEPGSGRPRAGDTIRPEPSKADFIAAARRAAQASAATPVAETRTAGRPAGRPPRARRGSVILAPVRVVAAHRRALLTAAAAVVLVVVGGRLAVENFGDRIPTSLDLSRYLPAMEPVESVTKPAETAVVQNAPADDADAPLADSPEQMAENLARPAPAAATQDATAASAPADPPVAPAAEPGTLATSAPVAPAPAFGSDTGQPPVDAFSPVAPDASDQTASLPSTAGAVRNIPTLPEGFGPPSLVEAALSGDPDAAFEVATRFTEGRGTEQDLAAAAKWYIAAADAGLAVAQYRIGSLYEKGQGLPRDMAEAKAWYERAAEAGNAKAMHNLAVLSADGAGGAPDYEAAARWFAAAAENGVRDSQYNLGILYAKGLGVDRDLTLSYKWFAVAAAGGDADAAKKRDDVAQVLDKDALARARLAVETWTPATPDPAVNETPKGDPSWAAVPEATSAAVVVTDPVAAAQAMLDRMGYDPGPADGKMGERTRLAIERFQKARGLPVTGEVDDALVRALSERAT